MRSHPGSGPDGTTPRVAEVLAEAHQLLEQADREELTVRLVGSTAIRERCPGAAEFLDRCGRGLKDIDVVIPKQNVKGVRKLAGSLGYTVNQEMLIAFEGRRLLLEPRNVGSPVDVFVDELDFCHRIDLRHRWQSDARTLSIADLLLAKLQIVDISGGDQHDMMALLLEYPVGESDHDSLNAGYIAAVLSTDWGFWYTATTNLDKLSVASNESTPLTSNELDQVQRHIQALRQRIESEPKSMKWKARAKIGTRKNWYNHVEEKQRAL